MAIKVARRYNFLIPQETLDAHARLKAEKAAREAADTKDPPKP
jgi:hypothetical protein